MTKLANRREEALFERVGEIIEAARGRVARTVNSAMVHAYWLIGREIVEVEQHGEELMNRLAERLDAGAREPVAALGVGGRPLPLCRRIAIVAPFHHCPGNRFAVGFGHAAFDGQMIFGGVEARFQAQAQLLAGAAVKLINV